MATLYRKREVTAQLIFDDLKKHGASTRWQVQKRLGLTWSQFQYGLGQLKDEMQTAEGRPLVATYNGYYSLTTDEGEWAYYVWIYRGKSLATQIRRWNETAQAGGILFGKRKKSTRILLTTAQALHDMIDTLVAP